jgi:hypothetical protein
LLLEGRDDDVPLAGTLHGAVEGGFVNGQVDHGILLRRLQGSYRLPSKIGTNWWKMGAGLLILHSISNEPDVSD